MDIKSIVTDLAKQAHEASYSVMSLSTTIKNNVLADVAELLDERKDAIFQANAKDMQHARDNDLPSAMLDRLELNDKRLNAMSAAILDIMRQEDPVGHSTWAAKRPNGLEIEKVRVPVGVIAIIYEARPNVTTDAFALSFKAGNSVILRGGSESVHSNLVLVEIIRDALKKNSVSETACTYIPVTDREALVELVKLSGYIDLVIPRGGEGLIRMVTENARVPVIKHYKGVCHVYVDESADTAMAISLVLNSKTQRPGVCNAAETLLMHKNFTGKKDVIESLLKHKVEVRADKQLVGTDARCLAATEEDWYAEYLEMIITAGEVNSTDEAIAHINKYGSHHSDVIVTKDYANGQKFLREVDSAVVYINASTRFTDGGEFGFGAEIGISTDKIHSRGPMGLEDLTTYKYIVRGEGQVRE